MLLTILGVKNTNREDWMASIRKQGDRYEIRECLVTARGPRQLSLASFRDILTLAALRRADGTAHQRPAY